MAFAGRAMISTGWISATWTLFHFHVGLPATEHRARPRECCKMKFEVHCGDVCVYGYVGTFGFGNHKKTLTWKDAHGTEISFKQHLSISEYFSSVPLEDREVQLTKGEWKNPYLVEASLGHPAVNGNYITLHHVYICPINLTSFFLNIL